MDVQKCQFGVVSKQFLDLKNNFDNHRELIQNMFKKNYKKLQLGNES